MIAALFDRWDVGTFLISFVLIVAVCAVVLVALRQFDVTVPEWLKQVGVIVLVAFVVVFAIRLILSF
jgi:hypothetical protein